MQEWPRESISREALNPWNSEPRTGGCGGWDPTPLPLAHQLSSLAVRRHTPSGDHLTPLRKFELGVEVVTGPSAMHTTSFGTCPRYSKMTTPCGAAFSPAPEYSL